MPSCANNIQHFLASLPADFYTTQDHNYYGQQRTTGWVEEVRLFTLQSNYDGRMHITWYAFIKPGFQHIAVLNEVPDATYTCIKDEAFYLLDHDRLYSDITFIYNSDQSICYTHRRAGAIQVFSPEIQLQPGVYSHATAEQLRELAGVVGHETLSPLA